MDKRALQRSVEFIDSWLSFRLPRVDLPGLVVAVMHDHDIVFQKAFGYANLERQEPMTVDHVFRIASQAKMFTATAVMQLAEAGKLRIDDPVIAYLPWLEGNTDQRFQVITIRQLLSHSSGLAREGEDSDYWQFMGPSPSVVRLKEEFLRASLVIDNNTSFKYSNYGYALLGLVIEAASGISYNAYVKQNIFTTLGLRDTGPDYTEEIGSRLVTGYTRADIGRRQPIANLAMNALAPAAGAYSTAADLCAFADAQLFGRGRLLNDESKKEMQRRQWHVSGESWEAGLGFGSAYVGTRCLVGFSGWFPGQQTLTRFDQEDGLAVVVLANCDDAPIKEIRNGIISTIDYFQKYATERTTRDFTRFEGRFMSLASIAQIIATGERIVGASPDAWDPFDDIEVLEYVDDLTLKVVAASGISSPGELVKYELTRDGEIASIRWAGYTLLPEAHYLEKLRTTETFGA